MVDFKDIQAAAQRLDGHAVKTNVLTNARIDAIAGCKVFAKAECNQKRGAFKYRGARNAISQLSPAQRASGIVAFSSGNHAQGVALVAKEFGISAKIVMPKDTPRIKIDSVKRDGANIVFYDRLRESREQIGVQIAKDESRILIKPFDDPHIIAGQGTVGLELAAQVPNLDAVVVCMGGGGLCAGIATAYAALSPNTHIFGAEPITHDDQKRSLAAGKRVANLNAPPSLCDALMSPMPGKLTFPIIKRYVKGVCTVTDEEALLTMAVVKRELDVILEPGGSVALASVLAGQLAKFGNYHRVGVILSGGNVDPKIMARAEGLLA